MEEPPAEKGIIRKKSLMSIQANPLESGSSAPTVSMKVENLTDAVLINPEDFDKFLADLKAME